MRIAIYAIVQNEQAEVAGWLETTQQADCRIVVDTGSTDDTVEMLEKTSAKIHRASFLPWRFDDALNTALALVPPDIDVCFRVDFDERPRAGWREELERIWDSGINRIRYPKYTGFRSVYDVRIHARNGFRWHGATHEILQWREQTPLRERVTNAIVVDHFQNLNKARPDDIRLLKERVSDQPSDPESILLLGRELLHQGQLDEASVELRRALALNLEGVNRAYALRLLSQADPKNAFQHLTAAENAFPSVSNHLLLAEHYSHSGQWRECYMACQFVIGTRRSLAFPILGWDDDWRVDSPFPHEMASTAAWNLWDYEAAYGHAMKAAAEAPSDDRLQAKVREMATLMGITRTKVVDDIAEDEFICFLKPGWNPVIRAAESTREWMDQTRGAYAYRCLPLVIANSHGWEILSPCSFEAYWDGGPDPANVIVRAAPDVYAECLPKSHFGHATLTFNISALFRTPPGFGLWVGGSPNRPKDGISPLTGLIETDWSPYTFTMNWIFTRANHVIRFEKDEPICCIFPIRRDDVTKFHPRIEDMSLSPALEQQVDAFHASRGEFLAEIQKSIPRAPGETWQKRYFRGLDMDGVKKDIHMTKLRLPAFKDNRP